MEVFLFISLSQFDDYKDIISLYQASNKLLRKLFHSSSVYIRTPITLALANTMKNVTGDSILVGPHENLLQFYNNRGLERFKTLECESISPLISLIISLQKIPKFHAIIGGSLDIGGKIGSIFVGSQIIQIMILTRDIELYALAKNYDIIRFEEFIRTCMSITREIKVIESTSPIFITINSIPKHCNFGFILRPQVVGNIIAILHHCFVENKGRTGFFPYFMIIYEDIIKRHHDKRMLKILAKVAVLIKQAKHRFPDNYQDKMEKYTMEYRILFDSPDPPSTLPVNDNYSRALQFAEKLIEKIRIEKTSKK